MAACVALSIVVALLADVPAVGRPVPAPALVAWTEAQAVRLASATGEQVEVQEKTSEFSRTFAEPDGTMTAQVSNTPMRINRDGQWIPVDTTLETRPDGSVEPRAAYTDMRFSGGGPGPLASVITESWSFSLSTPWTLSRPVLSGSTATYANVLPEVDLVVHVTVEGFSYNLVVRTRSAASNPALRSIHFPVTTTGLEVRNTIPDRPSYVDATGRTVLTVGEALMWDSAGRPGEPIAGSSSDLVKGGLSTGSNTAGMALLGDASGLTIEPNATMLTSADTVFPLVLDPAAMPGRSIRSAWAAAWELYPNTSFYKTNHSLGVGYEGFEQHKIVRSFWQFNIASFAGKKIVDAEFRVYSIHSASCTPKPVTVSRTGAITSVTTWNNQPRWQADVASSTFAKGYNSSCPDAYHDFTVTGSLQASATGHAATTTFRLRATDETDPIAWKQFNSSGELTIRYIAYPLHPYNLGAAAESGDPYQDCSGSADPVVLASVRPRFTATGRIGAGDTSARVKVQLQVVSQYGTVWTMTTGTAPPGFAHDIPVVSNLPSGTLFHYHARTLYPYDGGELVGPWTGDCYFRVDTTPPPPPTITASYKGQSLTSCLKLVGECPKVVPFGEPVTYTVSSSTADVISLKYRFSGSAWRQVSGRTVTLSPYPTVQGYNDMVAQAGDAAAHWSTAAYFRINVGPPAPPVASWRFDESSGTTAADSSGNGRHLTVAGAVFDDDGRTSGSLVFDGSGDYATLGTAPIDTSKSFTVSAWVRLTGSWGEAGVVGIPGAQALGAQLYYSKGVHQWVFIQHTSDALTAGQARVESVDPPLWGAWTHLAGVYNAATKTIALYVNGRLQDTATFTHTPWKANGPLDIGRYRVNGAYGAPISGSIDQVQLWSRALAPAEVIREANPKDAATNGQTIAGLAAHWPLDGAYVWTDQVWRTADGVYAANMPMSGFGGTAGPSGSFVEDEERGRVLLMTGAASESVSLPRPVVDTTGSFTVSVWAKLRDTSKPAVIVRQGDAQGDAWRLEFQPTGGNGAEWAFYRKSSTGVVSRATVETDVDIPVDGWTLLIGVYDAEQNTISLKVNEPRATDGGEAGFTAPVRGGTTVIGSGAVNTVATHFNGWLDELRLYSGVVSQQRMCSEIWGGTDCS